MQEVNIAQIQEKLYERFKPSGWADPLKSFLLSSEMRSILEQLRQESEDGKKFTPTLKQVFRAFEECPFNKLKVVILLQDPYPFLINGVTVADGIAMSVSNTKKIQPSLQYVHKEIKDTVYKDQNYQGPLDLKVWSNQGVLLLNIALTTTVGIVGTHYAIWRPFIVYLMDYLSWNNTGLIWVFMGKKSQAFMRILNDSCYKLTTTHPAAAAHNKWEHWDSGDIFNKVNNILERNKQDKIIW